MWASSCSLPFGKNFLEIHPRYLNLSPVYFFCLNLVTMLVNLVWVKVKLFWKPGEERSVGTEGLCKDYRRSWNITLGTHQEWVRAIGPKRNIRGNDWSSREKLKSSEMQQLRNITTRPFLQSDLPLLAEVILIVCWFSTELVFLLKSNIGLLILKKKKVLKKDLLCRPYVLTIYWLYEPLWPIGTVLFKGLLPQAFARDVPVEFTILMDLHMCHLLLVFEVHSTAQRLPHPRDVEVFFNLFCRPPKYHVQ